MIRITLRQHVRNDYLLNENSRLLKLITRQETRASQHTMTGGHITWSSIVLNFANAHI
jgi:hypothetical protein